MIRLPIASSGGAYPYTYGPSPFFSALDLALYADEPGYAKSLS